MLHLALLLSLSRKVTRRAVSVLGIVVFHTCGCKSEGVMAFGASRNREKKGQNKKHTKKNREESLAPNLWRRDFW